VNTPIKIIVKPKKHNKYSFKNIFIESQLAKTQIGINNVVNTINNKLIPSTPKTNPVVRVHSIALTN
jgi:hypothetical protein